MKLAWVRNRGMHGAGSKKMWFCSHLLAQVPTPLVLLSQALQAALQRVKSTQINARKKDLFRLYLVQNMCLPPLRNPRLLCKLKSSSIALTLQGSSLGTENECTWTCYLHCTHNTHSTLLRSVCLSLYLQRSYQTHTCWGSWSLPTPTMLWFCDPGRTRHFGIAKWDLCALY